jgi:hypothetical protein
VEPASVHDLRRAPQRTRQRRSARVESFSVLNSAIPAEGDSRGQGVVDFAAGRCHVTVRLLTERMRDYTGDRDSRLVREMKEAFTQTARAVFDGGRKYTATEPGDWAASGDVAGPRDQLDPLWAVDVLAGANDDATLVGQNNVRGVLTRRYRLTANLRRAAEHSPLGLAGLSKQRRWLPRRARLTWESEAPLEVWLDDENLVRRVSVAAFQPHNRWPTLWTVTELWDFGVPVDVDVPVIRHPRSPR